MEVLKLSGNPFEDKHFAQLNHSSNQVLPRTVNYLEPSGIMAKGNWPQLRVLDLSDRV